MRLFFALDVGTPASDHLRNALLDLRGATGPVRWRPQSAFHITLAFLGVQLPERAVAAVASARRALREHAKIRPSFSHVGMFPSWEKPRTVWAGLGKGAQDVSNIALSLTRALKDEGFELEERPFVPHATLGRLKSSRGVAALRERAKGWRDPQAWSGADFDVKDVVLYESRLSAAGAEYRAIKRIGLA